jgi:predicted short-subunit dehydrogenase-like oxidoreductase (DUF2520 family)
MKSKISIIGTGNLSYHLCKSLINANIKIEHIFFRNRQNIIDFNFVENDVFTNDINYLIEHSDIIFFAVHDHTISEILPQQNWKNKLLLHSAGSVSMSVFESYSQNFGVFYLLQSFSKQRALNYSHIPVLLEANSDENLTIIENLAHQLSSDVRLVASEQRKKIHLAAVFVNNFSNHMLTIAEQIAKEQNLDYTVFNELIHETFTKAQHLGPQKAQTGPALRNDVDTMNAHLQLLHDKALWKKIYRFVSQSIVKSKNK